MWHHIFHLIVRPFETLLGLFCVLSAILLYPTDEGNVQSKLEDFWVRVDDYQKLALSKHAAFMTGVSQLESRFLDRIFGPKLFSVRALGVSFCCSMLSFALFAFYRLSGEGGIRNLHPDDKPFFLLLCGLLLGGLIIGVVCVFVRRRIWVHRIVTILVLGGLAAQTVRLAESDERGYALLIFAILVLGGVAFDMTFIALTRRLLRWAGQMASFSRVAGAVFLNFMLAILMISPYLVGMSDVFGWISVPSMMAITIGASNFFDVAIALLFVLLAFILLLHRLVWPLLARTLFRMADIGTKGRRAILTTVGIALLGTSVFGGKFPELVAKVIEKLGG